MSFNSVKHNVLNLSQHNYDNKTEQISNKHSSSVFANVAHFPEIITIIS